MDVKQTINNHFSNIERVNVIHVKEIKTKNRIDNKEQDAISVRIKYTFLSGDELESEIHTSTEDRDVDKIKLLEVLFAEAIQWSWQERFNTECEQLTIYPEYRI